jgi:streptogramin lyase
VIRIDPKRGRVVSSTRVQHPGALAVGPRGAYVTDFEQNTIRRLDPKTLRLVSVLKLRLPSRFAPGAPGGNGFLPIAVAVGPGSVWIATERCALAHADPLVHRTITTVRLPCDAFGGLAVSREAVWVGEDLLGVYRVNPRTDRVVAKIGIGTPGARLGTDQLFAGTNTLLVVGNRTRANVLTTRNGLARINPARNQVKGVTPLPSGRLAVTFGKGSLWAAHAGASQVERIDPNTGKVVGRLHAHVGIGLAVVGSELWTITRTGTIQRLSGSI